MAAAKTARFTMGLPGAGKSYTAARLHPSIRKIDPDAFKALHRDYDPKDPSALHSWSKGLAEAAFADALLGDEDFLLDGTGTSTDAVLDCFDRARVAGFRVELLMVAASVETALARNAARARSVAEELIREKAEVIWASFDLLKAEADAAEVVWND